MRNAVRQMDMHTCMFAKPAPTPIPHVGGPVTVVGKRTVKINKLKAATFGDETECTGVGSAPPKDPIMAGCMKVFINGNPAARIMEKTIGGTVNVGSPNTFYADKVAVLSEKAANWMHQFMAQQEDIPFAHAQDGCYARAHEMARILEQNFNVEVQKKFVYGNLLPEAGKVTYLDPVTGIAKVGSPINWNYHVAPMVKGVDGAGKAVNYVIDPSISPKTVLKEGEWTKLSAGRGTISAERTAPSDVFYTSPDGQQMKDKGYLKTDQANSEFKDAVDKGEKATGDPDIDKKVIPKLSFPTPKVPAPHLP
jgi:uncharacterized Zn-binding protein involved in type VI secretion